MKIPHREAGLPYTPKVGIVTVSSSRYEAMLMGREYSDESGDLAERILRGSGIGMIHRFLIGDRPHQIGRVLEDAWRNGIELLIFIGGTGVSSSDYTYKTLRAMIRDELIGFNDICNMLSFRDIGARAVSSRLIAGWYRDMLVFALPGSRHAVELILSEIIIKEYQHLLWIRKYGRI